MHPAALLCLLTALPAAPPAALEPAAGLKVPPGFLVTEFAGSDLANDIYCMTLDPKGRVIVSGRGYVRLLIDETGSGKATKALDFTGAPADGAMGLLWEGDDLYCVGGGGLQRWRDANGAGRLRPPELLLKLKTGGEHEAHAVHRGPDGWLYILIGNNAGISSKDATLPTSPIKEPTAGVLLRLPPDFKGSEIVADGFRNAYGMDFNSDGEIFTYDSDNERCVSLPWYEGIRLYHVVAGGHHGWQSPQHAETWRKPPYFLDIVPPVATLGRGSPTGVLCYKHAQFPEKYRGGLFLADWTFGRINFIHLERSGSSYKGTPEEFLRTTGDVGLAPTALALHPETGDMYFSVGGRGTRGAVYRVRHLEGFEHLKPEDAKKLQPLARSLGWKDSERKALLARALGEGTDLAGRRQALELVRRHASHLTAEELDKVVRANVGIDDRLVRQAAARLIAADVANAGDVRDPIALGTDALGHVWRKPGYLSIATGSIADRSLPVNVRLDYVRLLQLGMGDIGADIGDRNKAHGTVWEGYTPLSGGQLRSESLRRAFPSGDADLDREISRTLAMGEDDDPAVLTRVSEKLTATSSPIEDVHYLIVLARLKAARTPEITKRTTTALLALDGKLTAAKMQRDFNWAVRVGEMFQELMKKDPALAAAMLASPDFGRPDHALFARMPGFDQSAAAERFLAASKKADFVWNADLVAVVGSLPPEKSLPPLRALWGQAGLDEVILPYMARAAQAEDKARLRSGLGSAQPATVSVCLEALDRLSAKADMEEVQDLLLALGRVPPEKAHDPLRDRILTRLRSATGQKFESADDWRVWYIRTYPDKAARLADPDGVDVAAWDKRLAKIDWSMGDAERGRQIFVKASCATCHSGSRALGPDLAGVGKRFSRADILTAIIRPSKDVSPRYRTIVLTTVQGKTYQGLIAYEAVDSVILQTGPGTTIRITNQQITERRQTTLSLMPAGLLDRLTDGEIADLIAFLK